jgi:hypothetical protein
LDLLEMDQYSQSASNLEQLLGLLEIVVAPLRYVKLAADCLLAWGKSHMVFPSLHSLSLLPRDEQEIDLGAEKSSPGKEWVKVPR